MPPFCAPSKLCNRVPLDRGHQQQISRWHVIHRRNHVPLPAIRSLPTKSEYNILLERFKSADSDGNGVIDRDELRFLLERFEDGAPSVAHWLTESDVDAVMSQFDSDNSGDISFEEFKVLAQDGALMHGALRDYEAAFRAAAANGSGVSAQELGALLHQLGHPADPSTLESVFSEYDLDGSGKIEFGEFLRLFRNNFIDIEEMLAYLQQSPRTATAAETDHGDIELVDGVVLQISSEAELDRLILATGSRLLVLEALKLHEHQVLKSLLHASGNEDEHTKHLFKERLQAKATPAFFFFRNGEMVHTHTGANKTKLETFVRDYLTGAEAAKSRPLY